MAAADSIGRGHRFKDVTGQRFNRLTVIELSHMKRCAYWRCKCDCGNEVVVPIDGLTTGHTKSCGCHKRDNTHRVKYRHGREPKDVWHAWCHVRARCYNPKNKSYHRYGGRGIRVCDRWLNSFEAFRDDMRPRPSPQHSIERKDNDGDYTPDNCTWATKKAQARNRRSSVLVEYQGRTQCVTAWAEELGIKAHTLYRRVFVSKWEIERALTTPVGASSFYVQQKLH